MRGPTAPMEQQDGKAIVYAIEQLTRAVTELRRDLAWIHRDDPRPKDFAIDAWPKEVSR